MLFTPADAAGRDIALAYLEIIRPQVRDPLIPLRFAPTEYQLQKANSFADIPIPGLESPPIQFVRGTAEKLVTEVLVDTSHSLEDVRARYVDKLRNLMRINSELHAPPIVSFTWDSQVFVGVLESLNTTFTMFTLEGVPLRAKLAITLKEYRPAAVQVKEPRHSPDVEKTYVVRRGDTLSGIAAMAYRDPTNWRPIARENNIADPRRLRPGLVLTIPRLT
jgi:nucleoid-associated protein YgaU